MATDSDIEGSLGVSPSERVPPLPAIGAMEAESNYVPNVVPP